MSNALRFTRIDQEEFETIDYAVMGIAYELQNEMGRVFNECIYRNELKHHLAKTFETVCIEVPIPISFKTFSKVFVADLVINSSVIYELKAIPKLVPRHRRQLLQYLHISNLKHGKLVNFGAGKVEGFFVSTKLTTEKRKELIFHSEHFMANGDCDVHFKSTATALLSEWGGFLSTDLIYEAVTDLMDLNGPVLQSIDIISDGRLIGQQNARLLSNNTAFKITAISNDISNYRRELQRFLTHTNLSSIQWVNMDHHDIHFETIQR